MGFIGPRLHDTFRSWKLVAVFVSAMFFAGLDEAEGTNTEACRHIRNETFADALQIGVM